MRTRLLLAAVVLALPGTTPARADHIKDPAEVMPAKTVVYVELRQPGQLVKELANLFEGSALGNVPDSLTKLFDRGDRPRGSEGLSAAGLLFAPEVICEVQRIRGAAVAFTGMGKMDRRESPSSCRATATGRLSCCAPSSPLARSVLRVRSRA